MKSAASPEPLFNIVRDIPGAHAWGRIASLIAICKLNGVEPFAYLKSTLEAIAAGHPKNRVDELLPWNFNPST